MTNKLVLWVLSEFVIILTKNLCIDWIWDWKYL